MVKKAIALVLAGCMTVTVPVYAKKGNDERVVTFACWAEGESEKVVRALAEDYEAAHEGVKIDVNCISYTEYLSKLNTLMAADSMPDVFQMVEGSVFEWGSKGAAADLKPLYDAAGINPAETTLEQNIFNDGEHIYGVGADSTTFLLYYNKDLLKESGIEEPPKDVENPWTWDEFVENAKILTKDRNGKNATEEGFDRDNVDVYGTIMPNSWTRMMPLLRTNGVGYGSEDGMSLDIATEKGIEVVQAIADLSLVENCAPTSAIAQGAYSDAPTMLMNGQLGMVIDGAWSLVSYIAEDYDIGVAQIPAFDHAANLTWCGGICMSPKAAAENPDAFDFYCYYTDIMNTLRVSKEQGVKVGVLPSKYTYDTEEGMNDWISTYGEYDATEVCQTIAEIMKSEHTTLGENVTLKNFLSIVDGTLMPALDSVWMGDATAEEVLTSLDVSDKLEGNWLLVQ